VSSVEFRLVRAAYIRIIISNKILANTGDSKYMLTML